MIFALRALATAISVGVFITTSLIALERALVSRKATLRSGADIHAVSAGLWAAAATLAALSGVGVWL